jgi:hypothetical protein
LGHLTLISQAALTYIRVVNSDPARLVQDWIEQTQAEGILHSRGRFTVDPNGAADLGGLARLRLSDVPLLLLAGAVEGGSRYFRVHGERNLRLSWEGPAGSCGEMAHSLLVAAQVDFRWNDAGFELPCGFSDYLGPLWQRGRHAPLKLVLGRRLISGDTAGPKMRISPRREGRLILVDRGIDFTFPAAFPGLDIVAWVEPLPGCPWPRQLIWSEQLRSQIVRIARALRDVPGAVAMPR